MLNPHPSTPLNSIYTQTSKLLSDSSPGIQQWQNPTCCYLQVTPTSEVTYPPNSTTDQSTQKATIITSASFLTYTPSKGASMHMVDQSLPSQTLAHTVKQHGPTRNPLSFLAASIESTHPCHFWRWRLMSRVRPSWPPLWEVRRSTQFQSLGHSLHMDQSFGLCPWGLQLSEQQEQSHSALHTAGWDHKAQIWKASRECHILQ